MRRRIFATSFSHGPAAAAGQATAERCLRRAEQDIAVLKAPYAYRLELAGVV